MEISNGYFVKKMDFYLYKIWNDQRQVRGKKAAISS